MDFHSTFQVSKDYLQKNPKTVTAILTALKQATDYINNDRADAVDLLASELNMPKGLVFQMMGRNQYSMVADASLASGSATISNFMLQNKGIAKIPDLKSYTDFSLLKRVDASLVQSPF